MKNKDWIKQNWIEKISALTSEELYEILTEDDGVFSERICKFCEQIYEPCNEELKDDSLCRERFVAWCDMKHTSCKQR